VEGEKGRLLRDREEQLELRWELLFRVQSVAEVQTADTAVGMHLDSQCLNVVGTVRTSGKVRQVELNLVPAFVQSHGHSADKRLHTRGGLIIAGTETPSDVLIVQHLNLKAEILLQVLNDHDEERKLDAEGLVGVRRACDEARVDVAADKFQDGALDVLICEALDMAVADLLVPNLERLRANAVEDG